MVWVRELPWANRCMHRSSLIKLTGHIENFHRGTEFNLGPTSILGDSYMPLSRTQMLTVLYVQNSLGNFHQRFDRALSWDIVMWDSGGELWTESDCRYPPTPHLQSIGWIKKMLHSSNRCFILLTVATYLNGPKICLRKHFYK